MFPIKKTYDEEGVEIQRDDDNTRFKAARDGDHFLIPFQCKLCHFRNLQGRDPIATSRVDGVVMDFMRRGNLDAFWSRETKTVRANLRGIIRSQKSKDKFGLREESMFPIMGPHPLKDEFGMGVALAVLDRSLDPGKYEQCVQWATFRKTRSSLTNMWQASAEGLSDRVAAYEKNKTWISSCPTHQFFFTRFMEGVHRRVGETVKRDEPVSIALLKAIMSHLENQWTLESDKPKRQRDYKLLRKISMMGLWFCGGFCTGLRGEEMTLLELEGTAQSLTNLTNPSPGLPPHFEFVVAGITKGNKLSGSKFSVPCVGVTQGTGLQPGRWAIRYCRMQKLLGYRNGRLFTMKQPNGKLFEFDDAFYGALEDVQGLRPDLIPATVDVREDYGILRSLRRGVTAHALNMQVDKTLVNAINRWRIERQSDGVPNLDMADSYARLDVLKPTVLRYSAAL